ncbi:MAG: sigma-E processing peptidase SpoIIGA [Clostridia bacterium]|nr:sigma-E processing peptidase SpoIIGA [Clostridia bacterium]
MTTVYVDVLFLINLSLDYMTLFLTGRLLHRKMTRLRLILVSVLLSLYSLWGLLICASYALLLVSACLSLLLGCGICYQERRWQSLFKSTLVAFGIGGALAGAILALYGVLLRVVPFVKEGNGGGIKVVVFTLLAGVSAILIYIGNRLVSDVRGTETVTLTVRLGGRTAEFRLLVDSGNLVRDPISGRRVIFLDAHAAKRRLGGQVMQSDYLVASRHYLPITTEGGKHLAVAYLPEVILLGKTKIDALVAISQAGTIRDYEGIFPAALMP